MALIDIKSKQIVGGRADIVFNEVKIWPQKDKTMKARVLTVKRKTFIEGTDFEKALRWAFDNKDKWQPKGEGDTAYHYVYYQPYKLRLFIYPPGHTLPKKKKKDETVDNNDNISQTDKDNTQDE